ncbi:prepilin peptidase [Irregularibacter muris]|uniref:Prepilin leader peptidase/N-methyltransferase n=1 Tax=Irregularibacter muris TaxID=1796619 RepID=A0AAE3L253_9FIRM|nr:A24 family peptidase [Irregularibacter muris]MCR1897974.1 prepilin peptidase [Irregularibacter muris]
MVLLIFILGLIIGSFLNVCIYRIPLGKSIAYPPSICGHCHTRLKPLDLFPVISWMFLRGKCRYCGESIDIRYPFVELFTGILFSLTYWKYSMHFILIPYLLVTAALIAITFIDIHHHIIPNSINLFIFATFFVFNFSLNFIPWKNAFLGALIGGGFLFILFLFTGGAGMGMGDVKLAGVLGLYLGWTNIILLLLLSFVLGGFFGMLLLALKIKSRKDAISFGPWIAMAAFITLLFGNDIIRWYVNLL